MVLYENGDKVIGVVVPVVEDIPIQDILMVKRMIYTPPTQTTNLALLDWKGTSVGALKVVFHGTGIFTVNHTFEPNGGKYSSMGLIMLLINT